MFTKNRFYLFVVSLVAALAPMAFPAHVMADNAWGEYHWARTQNPFTLKLIDSVTSNWNDTLLVASSDWSASTVLDTVIEAGSDSTRVRKKCGAVTGKIRVCNATYGSNGWLGIAQIWASGSHITKAVTKLNDTYFNTATYNTSAWKQLVMCQEIGHDFGLDHQDEVFDNPNMGTCMDYTSNPAGPPSNEHPNTHDYDQLVTIYTHLDSTTTIAQTFSLLPTNRKGVEIPVHWGIQIRQSKNGRLSLYKRDFGDGTKMFTFVIWAN